MIRSILALSLSSSVFLSSSSAAAAGSLSGFPKKVGGPIAHGATVIEQGSKDPAVVVAAGSKVMGFGSDGQPVPGLPIDLGADQVAAGDLASADMDGDGKSEIAVATTSGKLFLLSGGKVLPGFPLTLEQGAEAGPSFADLDGDQRPELLQGDRSGRILAVKKNGSAVGGFPLSLSGVVTSTVSAGRLKGELALAVGLEDGQVHVLDARGKAFPGFPLKTHFAVSGAPAFGDIDDDGKVDLVVASRDFKLYAVNGEGAALQGFPVQVGFACSPGPALVDLDGDAVLDVAFTTTDGSLHVVNGQGKSFPGFPVRVGSRQVGGVVAGDLDRDGRQELIVASIDGKVQAFTGDGKSLAGFPAKVPGLLSATPLISRAGKEGGLVVYVGSPEGSLAAVRFEGKGGNAAPAIAWAGAGHDAARTGRFFPSPPRFKDLSITPAVPKIDDRLRAEWTFFSVDGDREPTAGVTWTRNGKPVAELEGKREVPPRTTKKGEKWRYEIKVGPRALTAPEVTVVNTPPTAPVVKIEPEAPTRREGARAVIVKPATDADGDPVSYRMSWLVDGVPAKITTDKVPPDRFTKGQRWTLVVTSFDGTAEGTPVTVDVVVGNATPTAPVVALEPAVPKRGEPIKAVVQTRATDVDNDELKYRYRWTVDGQAKNYATDRASLPPEAVRKNQKVEVSVTAFDGQAEGPAVKASATLVNTAPPAPQVVIAPAAPRTGQPLRAVIAAQVQDPDGDGITYRATWTRNGKPWSGTAGSTAMEISGVDVRKGDRWAVQVTPNDGTIDGAPGSAQVQIDNTPPTAPTLVLKPEQPRAGAPLELEIAQPAEDPDGDAIKYTHQWTRGTQVLAGPPDRLRATPGELKKHEKVRVTVTPSDGVANGKAAVVEVEVENTPPTAPVIALTPATPSAQQPLKVTLQKPASDDDGDALTYRYVWEKNGVLEKLPDSQAELPKDKLRKGDRWTVTVRAFDGEALGTPVRAQVQIGNTPPPAPKVSLAPATPRRGDGLHAVLTDAVDPDGDPVTYRFSWKRDGKPLPFSPETVWAPRTDANAPKKGETWAVEVVAQDGEAESAPARAEVKIGNRAPSAPVLSLCDGPTLVGVPLEAKVVTPSTDADGDPVSYAFTWTLNGKANAGWNGKTTVAATELHKHDQLRVTATPSDGTESGAAGTAECTLDDTPPAAPEIALEPAEPSAESGIAVKILKPSFDKDGDKVTYRYAWSRDGVPFDPGGDGASIKPRTLKRAEVYRVIVTAHDGEQTGGQARASARVKNTLPPAPKVTLAPVSPKAGAKLTCTAETPKDADGDPVQLRYAWLKNGEAVAIASDRPELPAGIVRKGEKWRCEAWSEDGVSASARVGVEGVVENSPPAAPAVVVSPEPAGTDDDLECRVATEAKDADGDPIQYEYSWLKDGKPVAAGADPARIPASQTRKGEKWKCGAIASDGAAKGPAGFAERVVANSPPSAAVVALKPSQPTAGAAIECEIVQPAKDPDGDRVDYRFAWIANGIVSKASTKPQLAASAVKSGELWSCQVEPTDGELPGPISSSAAAAVR